MAVINLLKTFGCVFLPVGVTFFDSVGYVARVDGISMQPALNPLRGDADYVFLNKWAVRTFEVSRGDIIALVSPKDPAQTIIKRVVGLEGDVVSTSGYKSSFVRVPQGHCWVEGDHKGHSMDSNSFGPVALGLVTARATFIVWPPARWQPLGEKLRLHNLLRELKVSSDYLGHNRHSYLDRANDIEDGDIKWVRPWHKII